MTKPKRVSSLEPFRREIKQARGRGDSYQTLAFRYGCSRENIRQFLERAGISAVKKKPFNLSVASGESKRFFGIHPTEEDAIKYFFSKIPLNDDVWAYSVYHKNVDEGRRLWHNVMLQGKEYVRIGAPVYGFDNLIPQRRLALQRPLSWQAEKLATFLRLEDEPRAMLRSCTVKESSAGVFEVIVPKRAEISEEDEEVLDGADLLS